MPDRSRDLSLARQQRYNDSHRAEHRAYRLAHREEINAKARARMTPERRAARAEYGRQWRAANAERMNASRTLASARNPEAVAARADLNQAVRLGRIARQPCEICGSTRSVHGHHAFGYARDFAVAVWWLCAPHHRGMHAAMAAGG